MGERLGAAPPPHSVRLLDHLSLSKVRPPALESSSKTISKVLKLFNGEVRQQLTKGHQKQSVRDFPYFDNVLLLLVHVLVHERNELEKRCKKVNDGP